MAGTRDMMGARGMIRVKDYGKCEGYGKKYYKYKKYYENISFSGVIFSHLLLCSHILLFYFYNHCSCFIFFVNTADLSKCLNPVCETLSTPSFPVFIAGLHVFPSFMVYEMTYLTTFTLLIVSFKVRAG